MAKKDLLHKLPAVDEVLKSPGGQVWLSNYPRRYVTEAIREAIEQRRKIILKGKKTSVTLKSIAPDIEMRLKELTSYGLRKVINATGIVVHTNLGRSPLSQKALENIFEVASGYSTLEYDVSTGGRGKRYSHIRRLLVDVTGAEDGIVVNNNAGAVLLALNTLAKGKGVVVSRGELVEIGGSFRVPDVMNQSGAVLTEVGTTNKTHLRDYEKAINEQTALILKVHQSNYRITGFTKEVPIDELVSLGNNSHLPVMYDLGSGSIINLKGEPKVEKTVKSGADIITFSGDKLLGGPQAGIIVGKKEYIADILENPLLRALRIDKLTLAALEATLMQHIDPERAKQQIPTLRMLLESPELVNKRAIKIARLINKEMKSVEIDIVEDVAFAGGGSLPESSIKTYAVSIKDQRLTPNSIEQLLRVGNPPVIVRIKDDTVLLDARTIQDDEIKMLVECVKVALRIR
jgi:L-seryl-tRNA(Ser) seleniumtransferase